MSNKLIKSIFIIALGVCSIAANTLASDRVAMSKQIYSASGLEAQLDNIPATIDQGFQLASPPSDVLTPERHQQVLNAIAISFSPHRYTNHLLISLQNSLTASDQEAVLNWLQSPLGLRITQSEVASSQPDAMIKMLDSMDNSPFIADTERKRLIATLDHAIMATETAKDIATSTQAAIAFSAYAPNSVPGAHQYADFRNAIHSMGSVGETELRNSTRAMLQYTYRDLTDAELSDYISFAMSPAGTRYTAAIQRGFSQAFHESSQSLGSDIQKIITAGL